MTDYAEFFLLHFWWLEVHIFHSNQVCHIKTLTTWKIHITATAHIFFSVLAHCYYEALSELFQNFSTTTWFDWFLASKASPFSRTDASFLEPPVDYTSTELFHMKAYTVSNILRQFERLWPHSFFSIALLMTESAHFPVILYQIKVARSKTFI